MRILGNLPVTTFIADHWQQQPLLLRHALPDASSLIDGDDLAGIACEPDGDARLVQCHGNDWHGEHGPFDEDTFATLPAHGWTLLVQAVDQWIPDVGELLEAFAFLPRWRLDDIMVSYATDGGGVGPHFDYYDVFLLQASGQREWKIGQRCDAHSPLRNNPDMKLLRDFDESACHIVNAGDLLYLPAGIAHWGTAIGDDCITVSIGFRAPSRAELLEACGEEPDGGDDVRYRDTPASIDADPWRINEAALDNLQSLCSPSTLSRDALLRAFGCMVTEPRYPDHICAEEDASADALPAGTFTLGHHPASRFAYYCDNDRALLFVDGDVHATHASFAQGVCHGKVVISEPDEQALLSLLLAQGSLLP